MKGILYQNLKPCLLIIVFLAITSVYSQVTETTQLQIATKVTELIDDRVEEFEAVRNNPNDNYVWKTFVQKDFTRASEIGVLTTQLELQRSSKISPLPQELLQQVPTGLADSLRQRHALIESIDAIRKQAEQLPVEARPAFFEQWQQAQNEKLNALRSEIPTANAIAAISSNSAAELQQRVEWFNQNLASLVTTTTFDQRLAAQEPLKKQWQQMESQLPQPSPHP